MGQRLNYLYLYLLMLLPATLIGQVQDLEGKKIVDVQVLPVDLLHPADLARLQPLRVGQPFHLKDVPEAIDSLFGSGQFEDISVDAKPTPDGVIIQFLTKPAWFVGKVSVIGKLSPPPSRSQLVSSGRFSLGTPFNEKDVGQAVESITELMNRNGLLEPQIAPKAERDLRTQQVFITFQVTKGKRGKYEMPRVNGQSGLSDSTILRATGWRIPIIHFWRKVNDTRTRAGVDGLLNKYQGQKRLTAKVELDSLEFDNARRRIRPVLTVDPGPKVELKATGTKISKRILTRYVPVYEERAIYEDLLLEGKKKLQDYFQGQGYYDVEVTFRALPAKNDLQTIEYGITKGDRYKLVKVLVTGNKYFSTDTIRERMFMQPKSFSLRYGRYSEAFRRKDEESIVDLYRSNGFRDVKISSTVDRHATAKDGLVTVTVNVDEGRQWIVGNITLSGVSSDVYTTVMTLLTSTPGQPFADINMAADRSAVLTYFHDNGFISAEFKGQWQPSQSGSKADITYRVKEGPRQFVREVLISGVTLTRRSLVDKQITLKPGSPLSSLEQTEIQKRLYDLGIFARVDTAIQNEEGDTSHKYVAFDFDEANRYSVAFGLGAQLGRFGTPSSTNLSSPGGATGFSPQLSVDVSRQNFLGLGHAVSLRGIYSSLEKRASLSYQQPHFMDTEGLAILYNLLYADSLSVRTFASKRTEASVQVSQKFSNSLTGLFRYAYRRISVSQVIIPVLLVPQLAAPVRIGLLSANLVQDRRDNPTEPHRGIYNTFDLGFSSRYLGSQRSFGRLLMRNATYHRLTRSIVFARQTQFGLILPFSAPLGLTEQQSVPLAERFFGGGADSLRAFPYNQAGPRDTGTPLVAGAAAYQPTGFPLGGNALLFNNLELRFPVLGENIQGVIFHDMGNIYSSFTKMSLRARQRDLKDFDYAAQAVGVGIRYRTPVGPIRLDLAYSLNPPSYQGFKGTPQQLLLCNPSAPPESLPGYCRPTQQRVSHFQFFFSIGQTF